MRGEETCRTVYGEMYARLRVNIRELQPALQIFLRYADLGPGDFRRAAERWLPA